MADFRLTSTQTHLSFNESENAFVLDPGTSGELALWGGGPNSEALEVHATDARIVRIVSVAPPSRGSDLRAVRVTASGIGMTSLSAQLPDGRAWASTGFAVGFTPGLMVVAGLIPLDGSIPFSIGLASMIPIPVPGTKGLCIQLAHRGWAPKGGSTSSLFIQDPLGRRSLRLDYGYNVQTKTVDYHWNQKGTFENFGIANHTPAGSVGTALYKSARYFGMPAAS